MCWAQCQCREGTETTLTITICHPACLLRIRCLLGTGKSSQQSSYKWGDNFSKAWHLIAKSEIPLSCAQKNLACFGSDPCFIKTFYEQPHVQPWITHPGPTGCPAGVSLAITGDQEAEDLFWLDDYWSFPTLHATLGWDCAVCSLMPEWKLAPGFCSLFIYTQW